MQVKDICIASLDKHLHNLKCPLNCNCFSCLWWLMLANINDNFRKSFMNSIFRIKPSGTWSFLAQFFKSVKKQIFSVIGRLKVRKSSNLVYLVLVWQPKHNQHFVLTSCRLNRTFKYEAQCLALFFFFLPITATHLNKQIRFKSHATFQPFSYLQRAKLWQLETA